MKTLLTAFRSRGSVAADRLVETSGLYVLVTSGDDHYGRWNRTAASAVKCGRSHDFCTADKAKAMAMWAEYTANHIAR